MKAKEQFALVLRVVGVLGIFYVLRTGCQWRALNQTGICTSSSAHRRFMEWTEAGFRARRWVVERAHRMHGTIWDPDRARARSQAG